MAVDLSGLDFNAPVAATPQPNAVQTALGSVNLGTQGTDPSGFNPQDIDALIKSRTGEALGLVRGGSAEQLRLSELAAQQQIASLQPFDDLSAFQEQSAILGLGGIEAQEEAIAGIPVSEFNQELNRRQRAQQRRQAFAGGDVSGASLLGSQQLAAGQQADTILNRLSELEPLSAQSRTIRTALSGIDEATRQRQAQILGGTGTQLSNIRIGAAAPLISSRLQRAELSGLQDISSANQQAQLQNQLAGLGGQLIQSQPVQQGFNQAFNQGGFNRAGFGTDEFGLTAFQDPFA